MILPLAYYGDAILRKKAVPITEITDDLRVLVQNMNETMIASQGWALAAPQVHIPLRLFISFIPFREEDGKYTPPTKLTVYINPKILWVSDEVMTIEDGCLSMPKLRGTVSRPYRIKIEATDLDGNLFEEELHDYQAYGALHENDHLNGVLFIDRIKDVAERNSLEPKLRAIKKSFGSKKS